MFFISTHFYHVLRHIFLQMKKTIVAIAMGGYSSEYEISLKSGGVVYNALDKTSYEVYAVHLLAEGWHYIFEDGSKAEVNKANFGCNSNGKMIIPDVVFNTIHGSPGEDGTLAAYLEMLGIPQTSTDFYEAALSFNKRDCLSVLKAFGIRCAASLYLNKTEEINTKKIIDQVGLPCFVKPNRAGSSFGISKVSEIAQLKPAIEAAYKEDSELLIEAALVGTEVSVGVYIDTGILKALTPTEIVSENDFFDYEAKYLGKSQEITPARISETETIAVQKEAIKIYKSLNMKGVTRSDFILKEGIPYLIETNTTPGLSQESIIPKQVRHAGITLTHFFGLLLENALIEKEYF